MFPIQVMHSNILLRLILRRCAARRRGRPTSSPGNPRSAHRVPSRHHDRIYSLLISPSSLINGSASVAEGGTPARPDWDKRTLFPEAHPCDRGTRVWLSPNRGFGAPLTCKAPPSTPQSSGTTTARSSTIMQRNSRGATHDRDIFIKQNCASPFHPAINSHRARSSV